MQDLRLPRNLTKYSHLLFAFLVGLAVAYSVPRLVAFAHGGNPDYVHVCVDDMTGAMRMVGQNDTCLGHLEPTP